ncbi:hypothetical protein PM082_019704 [Marasmius tenuissimus]|nr:hypothetical protein PM082_019704 [Marasmius tenuissimus]
MGIVIKQQTSKDCPNNDQKKPRLNPAQSEAGRRVKLTHGQPNFDGWRIYGQLEKVNFLKFCTNRRGKQQIGDDCANQGMEKVTKKILGRFDALAAHEDLVIDLSPVK